MTEEEVPPCVGGTSLNLKERFVVNSFASNLFVLEQSSFPFTYSSKPIIDIVSARREQIS